MEESTVLSLIIGVYIFLVFFGIVLLIASKNIQKELDEIDRKHAEELERSRPNKFVKMD